ncbi:serine/threonine-protein kinase [Nostoc sp. 106C]|uniref:serine/threonine protein kinase n=1 Tax=Nostoc sp. 106C TaxID=1932667 RepID=UPI000A3AB4AC|nr:serine/threonine-protein kinase [Nostoc sp. 106C]OUL30127.1 serine/threonine protein kinase [Nostoc sp. RF31YmG]OUL34539.1 serine/threonine protein kinase [Nostoc sp. 106C]
MPWKAEQRLQNGKYVIDKVLGQGGFGITYKALHVELKRIVVIKTPNERLSNDPEYEKYIERFIQEGRTLARLSEDPHPHIVGVIDFFKESAIHCLVMNFVKGENLFEAVKRRGALPQAEIVPCIRQIGEALIVVHEAGLVHRDAHPQNIMLANNSKAVLIDFGIAKQVVPSSDTSINKDGHRAFAPYEQQTGGSREPNVDIYSLAATLYYAVTGKFPTNSLDRKLNSTSLTPPKQINRKISDQLNQAILNGMALEAEDRPYSMQTWLAMLEAPKATPPPSVEPAHRKEVIRSKPKLNSEGISSKSVRIIPWGRLIGVLFNYLLIGYFLAASNTPYIFWIATAIAVTVAAAGAEAWGVAWTAIMVMAWAVAWAVAKSALGSTNAKVNADPIAVVFSLLLAGFAAAFVGYTVFIAGEILENVVGDKLQGFNKVNTFLILASTSGLGLGLGWLGHRIF